MRALRIGFILFVSFMLMLAVISGTFGFYPPPAGPKSPDYPTSSLSLSGGSYQSQYQQYDAQRKQYEEEQKLFLQNSIVGYVKNIVIFWIVTLGTLGVIGLVLALLNLEVVGAAYMFTGFWAIFYGPLGCLIWFASGIVRSFGGRADQEFSTEPILQAVCITSIIVVFVLTVVGGFLFYKNRNSPSSTS